MFPPAIVQGAVTDHGSTVLEGHPGSQVNTKPVAKVGMAMDYPTHGRTRITTDQATTRPAAASR